MRLVPGAVFCLLMAGFAVGTTMDGSRQNVNMRLWNNGSCVCGGKWEYSNSSMGSGGACYFFRCSRCGDIVHFTEKVFVKRGETDGGKQQTTDGHR